MTVGSLSGSQIRILVVDDDQDLLLVLRTYLSRLYDVRAVSSGRQALEIAREWQPHTLVTDIRMPDMNGFMLLQEIARVVPGIHTIAFSANLDPQDERATELVCRYAERALGKPVHPDRLIQTIQEVMREELSTEPAESLHL